MSQPAWPGDARLALCVLLSLERVEYLPPPNAVVAPSARTGGPYPQIFDPHLVSLHEYGNRVGVFRVLDVLDRLGVRATAAVDAQVCMRLPRLVDDCVARGYEIAAHGCPTHLQTDALPEDEERALIREAAAAVEQAAGTPPRGWVGADYGESSRTPALLAEAGFRYVCDWPNDDCPYPIATAAGELVSLPVTFDCDDVQTCKVRAQPAEIWERTIREAAETLHAEGRRLLAVHVHPWVSGQPFRIRALERALTNVLGLEGVWQATAGEVVAHACPD